jgi:type I restriction enzyme M protein
MNEIEEGSEAFHGLFGAVDLDNSRLSRDIATRRAYFEETLKIIDSIKIAFDDSHIDVLGETYEYLLGRFFESSINEAGKFFTPQAVSEIMARIVTHDKTQVKNIYDPTCGTGSLLFRVYKQLQGRVSNIYGQDSDGDNISLAKMNMLLHGVKYDKFSLLQEDTLLHPQHLNIKMDIVVANPPYNVSD